MGLYGVPELVEAHADALSADPPRGDGVPLAVYTPAFAFLQNAPWVVPFVDAAVVRMRASSSLPLLAAARAGLALAALPRFVAAREPGLVAVPGPDLSRHRLWLAVHTELRRDPRVAAVMTFLRDIAPSLAGDPPGSGGFGGASPADHVTPRT